MAATNPTIVVGHLNDQELKSSIDALVQHIRNGSNAMVRDFDTAISSMKASLNSLKSERLDFGNLKQSTREIHQTLDQQAQAMQKSASMSSSKGSIFDAYTFQIDLLNEKIKAAENQVESFKQMARHGAETGDKGLFVFATEGIRSAENDLARLHQQIDPQIAKWQALRDAMNEVMRPQGHSFENYVKSLTQTNPELAKLNDQFRRGVSLMQTQGVQMRQTSEEQAQATRERIQAENRYAQTIAQREADARAEVIRTGETARDTARKIAESMQSQLQLDTATPIMGVKELSEEIKKIRTYYYSMSNEERQSAFGSALGADIERLKYILNLVQKYNRELAGLNRGETDTDKQNYSYSKLSNTLKELTSRFNELSRSEAESARGKGIADEYQRTARAAQELKNILNRPTSLKNALGLDEHSLDQIEYKMRQLAAYRSGLNFTDPKQQSEIQQVNNELDRLRKKQVEIMGQNNAMMNSNNALTRSFNYMKNRLAFYFTVGASTQFVRTLVDIRGQYEATERALGILIESAQRGSEIFKELSNMALISPYTLIELSNAAKQLVAYDVAARDVVDTTRRLADIAAAVGVPLERLTYALGQIKAYGYLNSRDARMFLNAGIPLVKELANHYTELEGHLVTTGDIYDRIKKKAIGYNDVMAVLNNMTDDGGRFFDFQAKMADTLKVQLANLTLAWNNMLNDIGGSYQGPITMVIKGLKQMFLHWKDFDKAIKAASWYVGIRVGLGLVTWAFIKASNAMGDFTYRMSLNAVAGARFANMLRTLGRSLYGLLTSMALWRTVAVFAFLDIARSIITANDAQKEFNKSVREGAKQSAKDIEKFISDNSEIREKLYQDNAPVDLDKNEANKLWESMREQIELSSKSGGEYVMKLMEIENVSERIRQGFNLLDTMSEVHSALSTIDKDTIRLSQDWSKWWNLWGIFGMFDWDNLQENLEDYGKAVKDVQNADDGDNIERKLESRQEALRNFRKDLEVTTNSLLDFINLKGWSGDVDKINEVFSFFTNKYITDNSITPQDAFNLQLEIENARAAAAKQALYNQATDMYEAWRIETDERMKYEIGQRYEALRQELVDFDKFNGASRVYWNDFTKWMKEQHISETTAMFRNMDAEQIKSLDFTRGEYYDWVTKLADKYAKEHKMAYSEVYNLLRNYITNANQWSIFIPLTIGTGDEKTEYQTLTDADNAIETAFKKITRLQTRKNELESSGAATAAKNTKEAKEYAKVLEEIEGAQKEYNDALALGGHSKKEDAAARKAQKQAESELKKTLSEELKLIDKVRSSYKDLTKSGLSHLDALEMATSDFDESVNAINKSLVKFGLPKLNLKDFAGTSNPQDIVRILENQLNILVKSGSAKPAEIENLQVKIRDLKLDVAKFNQKAIVDSLNNELGKFKDEYELAMELDASPEMSSAFMSMMGISEDDLNNLPRTYEQLAKKLQQGINNVFSENGITETFNLTENLKDDDFKKWVEANGHLLEDDFVKALDKIREYANKTRTDEAKNTIKTWDGLVEKYGELQSKLNKISREATKKQVDIIKQFGSDEDKSNAINLMNKINLEDNPQEISRLQKQLSEILQKVLSDNPDAFKISDAIANEQNRDSAKAQWENFKNGELYAETFDKLKYVGTSSIKAIIEELEKLKDKVKEDPASMKALMDALNSAKDEWTKRDPFGGMARSMGSLISALKERRQATKSLREEEEKLRELQSNPNSGPQEIADQQNKVSKSEKRHKKSLEGVREAMAKFEETCKEASNAMQSVASLLDDVNNALGLAEDSDVSIAIKSMADGFSTMATVLGIVASAAALAQLSLGWVAAVAAALAVLIGLVTFLANRKDNHILKQIKESEETVKNLELAYKKLQFAVEDAFGTAVIGAQQAAIANKRLQLAELERQLQLQKSRDGKKRDEDAIRDLEGQIVDLKHEISESLNEITENLLGISSVGDAVENMVGSVIEALRSGENAIDSWNDSLDDMIANMIKKFVSTKMVGPLFERVFDRISKDIQEKSQSENDTTQAIQSQLDSKIREYEAFMTLENGMVARINKDKVAEFEKEIAKLKDQLQDAESKSLSSSVVGQDDIVKYAEWINELKLEGQGIVDFTKDLIDAVGLDSGKTGLDLSALQQGIQSITEDQAGALEAYWNANTQQQYVQSDLLTQIRDAVVVMDFDSQLGTMGEILLQLQQSYQVQMSIQGIMEGWSTPNGMGVRVEMI